MLFNSIDFAIFLPIVFILYWFVVNRSLRLQNLLLLVASYIFYGWWDWQLTSLIAISSLVDYFVGIGFSRTDDKQKRKLLLISSLSVNLGLLGFFKYFNFFAQSFADAFSIFGQQIDAANLSIILPVGISFYTFQTLSYSIDVYKRKLDPSKDFISFFAFVSFFPQLVAGPIERATNLLPQFKRKRVFQADIAIDGLRQILWGLFKKMVIADNCAEYANHIFNNYHDYSGSTLVLGAIFFTFQIYGDFSGYSDIAIGTSRLFGFNLRRNFAMPYFSRDIAEFWRRWHISLSTWFRDYLYIPLGGSSGGTLMKVKNTFIIFIVSGFWHGANWTFVVWGALNAIYFLPLLLAKKNRKNVDVVAQGKYLPSIRELFGMITTFSLTMLAWVFFRADSVTMAIEYLVSIFSLTIFSAPKLDLAFLPGLAPSFLISLIALFVLIEWFQREQQHGLQFNHNKIPPILRWTLYYGIVISLFWLGGDEQEFIYFQF